MILESMKNVPKYIPHYTRVKKLINELHEKREMTMTLLERITKLGSIDGMIWMVSRGYVKIEQYEDGSCGYPALDNNGLYSKDSKFKIMEHNFSELLFHHGFFTKKEDYEEWLNNGFSLKQVYLIRYENTKKL